MIAAAQATTLFGMNEADVVLFTGAFAFVVAVWGVMSSRRISSRQVTIEQLSLALNDGDYIAARRRFVDLSRTPGQAAICAQDENIYSKQSRAIRLVLNNWELISIGIQRGIIDYSIVDRFHRGAIISDWEISAPFILELRRRAKNPRIRGVRGACALDAQREAAEARSFLGSNLVVAPRAASRSRKDL